MHRYLRVQSRLVGLWVCLDQILVIVTLFFKDGITWVSQSNDLSVDHSLEIISSPNLAETSLHTFCSIFLPFQAY